MAAGDIEKVTITITTRNAAFTNEADGTRPDWTVEHEVARILRGIISRADLIGTAEERPVRDLYGNTVGAIIIEREEQGS